MKMSWLIGGLAQSERRESEVRGRWSGMEDNESTWRVTG